MKRLLFCRGCLHPPRRAVRLSVLSALTAAIIASPARVGATSAHALSQPPLPDAVVQALDRSHPGWLLATVDSASLERCGGGRRDGMTASLVWADFNGDGVRDYAALVDTWGTRSVVVLPSRGGLLSVMRRGSRYFDHGRARNGVARVDSVVVAQCENSAVAYLYEDGRFIEVVVSD